MPANILILSIFFSSSFSSIAVNAHKPIEDLWLEFAPKQAKAQNKKFKNLSFNLEESKFSCRLLGQNLMSCSHKSQAECQWELEFRESKSPISLPLLRLSRRWEWTKMSKLFNYIEPKFETGLGSLFGQQAIYYRLNNIRLPVLLRAFDVVISEKTCISIRSMCDLNHWPLLEQDIKDIEASLKFTARY